MQDPILNQKIKCIALDLDRTTLCTDGSLSGRTKRALERAIACGMEVVVVSGRPFDTLPESVLNIEGIRYAATSNGAAVYETRSGRRLHGWTIAAMDVEAVLRCMQAFFAEGKITYEVFVDGIAYAPAAYVAHPVDYGIPARAVAYTQTTRRPVPDILSFIRQHQAQLDSIDIILKDPAWYQTLEQRLSGQVKDIYLTSSVEYRIEISHKDAGKAAGLNYILEMLGIRKEETIAFGDGDNDADMLRFAGVGVAMKNATPSCIASADLVGGSNDEDGVAEIIEKIAARQ